MRHYWCNGVTHDLRGIGVTHDLRGIVNSHLLSDIGVWKGRLSQIPSFGHQ